MAQILSFATDFLEEEYKVQPINAYYEFETGNFAELIPTLDLTFYSRSAGVGKCMWRRAQCSSKGFGQKLFVCCSENDPGINHFLQYLSMERSLIRLWVVLPFLHLSPLVVADASCSGRRVYEANCFVLMFREWPNQHLFPSHGGKPTVVYSQDIQLNSEAVMRCQTCAPAPTALTLGLYPGMDPPHCTQPHTLSSPPLQSWFDIFKAITLRWSSFKFLPL